VFARRDFGSSDTASLTLKALLLYQDLIRFHLKEGDAAALGDANLQRLQFVWRKAVMADKDSLYVQALRHVLRSKPGRQTMTLASSLLARWYDEQGARYDPFSQPDRQFDLKKALDICRAIPAGPVTAGSVACRQLAAAILRPEVSVEAEQVNIAATPFRVLVSYRNAFRLWFRLVKLPEAPRQVYAGQYANRQTLMGMDAYRQWEQDFPDKGDYQSHSAETKVDGLPHGRYALLVSPDSTFREGRYPVESVSFFVSDLSCIANGRGDYLVVDRESGKPLKGASVRLWTVAYNADSGKSILEDIGQYRTDGDGYFHADSTEGKQVMAEISYRGDHLYTGGPLYVPLVRSGRAGKDSVEVRTWLFTDRSIYRPGQILYFKGIVFGVHPGTHESHVVSKKQVKVFLVDAGGRKADSLQLMTGDFGSYTGHFQLPSGSLNGSMRLEAEPGEGNAYFSVEDYKRPGFYVRWDTAGRSYRLEDTVTATGEVTSYTGALVGAATIRYTVTRRTRMPFPFRARRLIAYPQQATIAEDTTSTDPTGKFSIRFPAIPDREVDSSEEPVFDYTVSVQVTDIDGETQNASQTIPVGYKSVQLALEVPAKVAAGGLDTVRVNSTDLSGTFIPVRVTVGLFGLTPPSRYIRARFWKRPDVYVIDRKTYLSLFPHDEYANESKPESWPRKPAALTFTAVTSPDGVLAVPAAALSPGWYAVEADATDRYGRKVTAVKYMQVYGTGKPPYTAPLWTGTEDLTAGPGDKVSWKIATGRHAYVLRQQETLQGAGRPAWLKRKGGMRDEDVTVHAAGRGGMVVHYLTVKDNRLYTADVRIAVPWGKKLHFTYSTFRDKLLPGAEETWTVKITGADASRVNAELLASMYDASLDAFRPHDWMQDRLYPELQAQVSWERAEQDEDRSGNLYSPPPPSFPEFRQAYPSLNWFGYRPAGRYPVPLAMAAVREGSQNRIRVQYKREAASAADTETVPAPEVTAFIRKDFRETAFFLPQLRTDDTGGVSFSFTTPEALTTWKLMLFAHTPDMRYGFSSRKVVTQKPLMIQAAAPRFVRQGDSLVFTAKISNLSGTDLRGLASLQLSDPASGEDLDSLLGNLSAPFAFVARAHTSVVASWTVNVPADYTGAVQYQVTADAGNYSDGEQDVLPVLTNKAFLTESLPLHFTGSGIHHLQWKVLKDLKRSSAVPSGLTVTSASNPVWYAVVALPLLDQSRRESADAIFEGLYARSLSGHILDENPHFASVFDEWTAADTAALKSPLEENQQLKTVLLQETPWVQDARDEAAQRAEVAAWYRKSQDKASLAGAVGRLKAMQLASGAFPWFHGMTADNMITRRILTGLGHLHHLGAWPQGQQRALSAITAKGVPYMDAQMKASYDLLMKNKQREQTLSPEDAAYLYMRSFFPDIPMADSVRQAYAFYQHLAATQWTAVSPYLEAMTALALSRSGDAATPKAILRSLSERALHDGTGGMYWKDNRYGYLWYQAPVEAQSVCIEAFDEIARDSASVAAMCSWLLEQKQGQSWPTGRGTADAVYALLLGAGQWTDSRPVTVVSLGGRVADSSAGPGAGYSRAFIPGAAITPAMGDITVSIQGAAEGQPVWISLYYQYFGNMEKAEASSAGLSIRRQVSLQTQTPQGAELQPLTEGEPLQAGDKVQVRIVVKADRDLDYVHLKDVLSSCMEPVQTLSGYHAGQGTSWYTTFKDAAMHFYFPHLSRGTYVFTYPVYISHAGSFSGGMSVIECLYAPEFRAHSEGVEVNVGQVR
jgi:hypothetical protein